MTTSKTSQRKKNQTKTPKFYSHSHSIKSKTVEKKN